ncbi:chromatin assembly factor 1 subunit A-like [Paramacrobiotus metropolitanus]|uniref:chromatin assembly factor 1 subunit A-like n=1 Tax=Paramacrobiotus metropolitanus TaxID=2943436 RepID=UPI002445BCF2|nr:chromatin assembly factor 1 subunit A-like [Paramacrobiotus metropolitanus]
MDMPSGEMCSSSVVVDLTRSPSVERMAQPATPTSAVVYWPVGEAENPRMPSYVMALDAANLSMIEAGGSLVEKGSCRAKIRGKEYEPCILLLLSRGESVKSLKLKLVKEEKKYLDMGRRYWREAKTEQKNDEKKQKEEEKKMKEEERKQKEAEREEQKKQKEEERKKREEQKKEKEEERKKREDEKNEQRRKREEERKLKLEQEEAAAKAKEKKNRTEAKQRSMMESFVIHKEKAKPVHLEGSGGIAVFQPFEVQKGVFFPPYYPPGKLFLSESAAENLLRALQSGGTSWEGLYLAQLKRHQHVPQQFPATCPRRPLEKSKEVILDGEDEIECSFAKSSAKYNVKLLQFSDNARPPYYGTMRKTSSKIHARNPFNKDADIEYDVDSDEEWEEEQIAAKDAEELSVNDNDDEEEMSEEEEDDDDGFFVKDDEEFENSNDAEANRQNMAAGTIGRWLSKRPFKKPPNRYIIGPFWAHQEAKCPEALKKLTVIPLAQDFEEIIEKAVAHEDMGDSVSKIPAIMMPFLIKLTHGSGARKPAIAKAFLNLWEVKENRQELAEYGDLGSNVVSIVQTVERPRELTKGLICTVIGSISTWSRPPATEKHRRHCHYVSEKVRVLYKTLEGPCLPNLASCKTEAEKKRKVEEIAPTSPEIPFKQAKVETPNKEGAKPAQIAARRVAFWNVDSKPVEKETMEVVE